MKRPIVLAESGASFLAVALVLAACSSRGQDGPPGAPGAQGTTGDTPPTAPAAPRVGSINQVTPRAGLVDREVEVTITADGVTLDASAQVGFGDGVKVVRVAARGPALVVTVAVAPNAKLGARDVTVTPKGGEPMVAKKGFVVAAPLGAKVAGGKAEQGGLVQVDVTNQDRTWFDPENFTLFPLVAETDASLVALASQQFTATDGSVILLGDPLAKTGPLGFLGVNDPQDPDSASFLTAPDAVTVTARAADKLVSGALVEKTLGALETGFFLADLAPGTNEGIVLDAWVRAPEGSTMKPMVLAYPESGMARDLIDQKQDDEGIPFLGIPATTARIAYPVTRATKGFFVVLDASLGGGPTTKFALEYSAVRAQILKEKPDAHATPDKAQNLGSLPGTTVAVAGRILEGELTANGESDVYAFTGLSAKSSTDLLVSVTSEAEVVVTIDTVPTMDSEHAVQIQLGGGARAAMGATTAFVGANRYIQVTAAPDAAKATGKYTLGMKRLPAVTVQ